MKIIVAIDRKGAIGRGGDLLYHIGADLRRFKADRKSTRLNSSHP